MNRQPIINTRADLDAIAGTPEHAAFIAALKGACTVQTDTAVYPENYDRSLAPDTPGYIAPQLVEVPTDAPAARFGYTRAELLAL